MMCSNEDDVVTCRSCISECTEYKNIHRHDIIMGEKTSLATLLSYCTDLSFPDDEDFMPSNMCDVCIENLYNFYAFKQTVIKVDQRLRWEHSQLIDAHDFGKLDMQLQAVCDEQQQYPSHKYEQGDSTYSDDPLEGALLNGVLEDGNEKIVYEQESPELEHLKVDQEDSESETYCDSKQDSHHNASETSFSASESEDKLQQIPEIEANKFRIKSISRFKASKELKGVQPNKKIVGCSDAGYKCEICKKSYRQRGSLRKHLKMHQGAENTYLCDICGKRITQMSGYKKHMLTHTGEKPHACDICGRNFRYSSNLIIHKRRHAGERPFNCSLCEKSFYTTEKVKRHMKTHARDGIFNCEDCGEQFRFRNTLKEHLRTCMRRKILEEPKEATEAEDD